MRTGNDCLVCFLRQTLATVRRCTDDPLVQWQIVTEVGAMLAGFDPALPPPENAVHYYRLIAERTGVIDPYLAEKNESNSYALALEARTRELSIEASQIVVDFGIHDTASIVLEAVAVVAVARARVPHARAEAEPA